MQKLYNVAALLMALNQTAAAQVAKSKIVETNKWKHDVESVDQRSQAYVNRATPIWSSNFTNTNDWVLGNTSTPAYDWEIVNQMPAGLVGQNFAPTLNSTSGGNFAVIDSDSQGSSAIQDAWMQISSPLDLSSYPNVIISWQQYYRHYQDQHYVEVSTNGGATWTSFLVNNTPNSITSPNVQPYALNISSAAGGQSNVLIRFRYTGNWGWFWAIDDVGVFEQPANDLINIGSYISHVTTGLEYGRIPADQLGNTLLTGSSVFNFGYQAQNNISLAISTKNAANAEVYSTTLNQASIAPNDTVSIETNAPTANVSAMGRYESTFTVQSTAEQSGAETFADNIYKRAFEVSFDKYSLDGLGNHPTGFERTTSLGSNSFTDAADGLMLFTMYPVSTPILVRGIEVMLTQSTQVGGSFIVSLHDSTNVMNDDVTSPIATSDIYDITSVPANGLVTVNFPNTVSLQPGNYFAGVELFSNAGANIIRIVDDLTVPQPYWGSMIYIPNDQVYSNGEAMAIRLVLATEGINDQKIANLFSVSPNPANDQCTLNFGQSITGAVTISLVAIDGRVVLAKTLNSVGNRETIDLSGLASGLYTVLVRTNNGFSAAKVVKTGN